MEQPEQGAPNMFRHAERPGTIDFTPFLTHF